MSERVETLVVGAGISGLAYGHYAGSDSCLVLDADERAGGLIHTEHEPDGLRHEWGPETISDADGSALALMDELGLEVQRAPANASKRFLAMGGRLREIPMSPPKLLFGDFLPIGTRLRMICEPWRSKRKALDGSVAEFMLHRVGRGVLETLVDPMLSGIHGAAPEELSMRSCFPQVVSGVEQYGSLFGYLRARQKAAKGAGPSGPWKPKGGMGRLPKALAEELGDRLRLGVQVDRIERRAGGWRVLAGEQRFEAERLVLALPQKASARLLTDVAPLAAGKLARATNESLSVHVSAYRRDEVQHALDGFGYLVPSSQGLQHLGTLFSSSLDPECAPGGTVLLRTMLGGSRQPSMHRKSAAEIEAIMRSEVHPLLSITSAPTFSQTTHHVRALPRYDLAHLDRVGRIEAALPAGLQLLGNHRRGIGIPALIRQARELAVGEK